MRRQLKFTPFCASITVVTQPKLGICGIGLILRADGSHDVQPILLIHNRNKCSSIFAISCDSTALFRSLKLAQHDIMPLCTDSANQCRYVFLSH